MLKLTQTLNMKIELLHFMPYTFTWYNINYILQLYLVSFAECINIFITTIFM